jgi:protein arginine kinase
MSKWYEGKAPHDDIVLSSRIRLARNLSQYPFEHNMTDEQRFELSSRVQKVLEDVTVGGESLSFCEMDRISDLTRGAMMERHLISREFVRRPQGRLLALSKDESLSVMVNEEDHLRIQALQNGLNLTKAYQMCNELDDELDHKLDYAFDEKLGFLTTCPTNLGTGLRASVMVHLPALEKSGLMNQLTSTVNKLGLTIRGTYGEGSKVLGSIYQISNQITLGITEQDAIQNLESIVLQIIESEKHARENLRKNIKPLEDVVYRSLGTLRYARLISTQDFFELISNLRLGIAMGILSDPSLSTVNRLMTKVGTASVCERAGEELSAEERDYLRAQIIRDEIGPC